MYFDFDIPVEVLVWRCLLTLAIMLIMNKEIKFLHFILTSSPGDEQQVKKTKTHTTVWRCREGADGRVYWESKTIPNDQNDNTTCDKTQ
jgi:hypothetical protein